MDSIFPKWKGPRVIGELLLGWGIFERVLLLMELLGAHSLYLIKADMGTYELQAEDD